MVRYDKYKDSGFEWIGKIPEHWKIEKLGWQGIFSASGIDKKTVKGEPLVKMINYTDVYGNNDLTLTADRKYMIVSCPKNKKEIHQVKIGDLIFTPSSETADEIGLSALVSEELPDTVYSYHVIRLRFTEDFDINFRKYFCNNNFVLNQFSKEAKGTTRQIIGRDVFKNIQVVIPPKQEQTAIATYLDRKTAQIDELIAKKERLLELYEEEKTAIINQAVTKGINPDIPMKDSGIDWLGEIPEHWKSIRLKYIGHLYGGLSGKSSKDFNQSGNPDNKLFIPFTNIANNIAIDPNQLQYVVISKDEKQNQVKKGDLFFMMSSENYEDVGKSTILLNDLGEAYLNSFCKGFRITEKNIFPTFVNYLLLSHPYRSLLLIEANGFTRINLKIDKVNNLVIKVPPFEEQTAIVQYIEKEINRINAKAEKTKKLIELLKEYKQALISEVVTGKIKVV